MEALIPFHATGSCVVPESNPKFDELRSELRGWITRNKPTGLDTLVEWTMPWGTGWEPELEMARHDDRYQEWERMLLDARLICPQWPRSVGGRGWAAAELAVFAHECIRQNVPRVKRGMGEGLVGPAVLVHGTEEQQERFLPRIISGADTYCQGFSEPGYGSDLAGVQTRGVVEGDEILITGQKVWTSEADLANMIFLLCRTDVAASKHRGLSYVLVEFSERNNIETRQVRQMTGDGGFYEDFFDGARAPLFNIIGGLGNGWRVAMTTLAHERADEAETRHIAYLRQFWELVELVRSAGNLNDPVTRQRLAWAYTQVQIMRCQSIDTTAAVLEGEEPILEEVASKLFWSEYQKALGEFVIGIGGLDALVQPPGEGYPLTRWQRMFLESRAGTIYAGTSEIQRTIIAQRALGLPREPTVGAADSPT
jgi:alkylation response protein AidB-like acyl-CoA dehydrogenase